MTDYTERARKVNETIQAIKDKFSPRIAALQDRAKRMQEDFKTPSDLGVLIGVDIKVDWKDVDIVFDVPFVTMKQQSLRFNLPETTMKLQTLSWDMPAICMKYVKFPWGGGIPCP